MEAFGINFVSIIAYLLIFLILYLLGKRFVNCILQTYDLREKTIKEGLKNAELASELKKEALKEAHQEKELKLKEAYSQAEKVLETAQGQEMKLLEVASNKAKKIISDAKDELESLKGQARKDGLKEAKDIIRLAIAKAFEGITLDKKVEDELVEKSIAQLKSE